MQIGRIDNLIDSFHGDIIEINRYKLKSYETALEETKKELELYNNLGASISRMEDLKKKYDILQEKQCRLNALKKLKEEYSKYKKEVGLYRDEIREVENKLQYEKKINGLENSKNIITKLINLRAKYNFNKNNIEECQRIIKNNNKIADLDMQNLSDKLIKYKILLNLNKKYVMNKKSLKICTSIIDKNKNIMGVDMEHFSDILRRYAVLLKLNQKYCKINVNINKCDEVWDSKQKEILNAVNSYTKFLKEIGRCPTCFTSIEDMTIDKIKEEIIGEMSEEM
jgi:hypothetical protein